LVIYENIEKNQRVLDLGCTTGYLGEFLKDNFEVVGLGLIIKIIILNEARKSNIYSDLIKLNLNTFGNEINNYTSYFDRIILADVLEHLIDPMEVLRKLSKWLRVMVNF